MLWKLHSAAMTVVRFAGSWWLDECSGPAVAEEMFPCFSAEDARVSVCGIISFKTERESAHTHTPHTPVLHRQERPPTESLVSHAGVCVCVFWSVRAKYLPKLKKTV